MEVDYQYIRMNDANHNEKRNTVTNDKDEQYSHSIENMLAMSQEPLEKWLAVQQQKSHFGISISAGSSPAGKNNPIPPEAQKKINYLQKSLTFNMEQVQTLEEEKIMLNNLIDEYKNLIGDLRKKIKMMEDQLKSNLQDTLEAQKAYELQIQRIVKDTDVVIAKFQDENNRKELEYRQEIDKIELEYERKISNMKVKLKLNYEALQASRENKEALKAHVQSMQININTDKKIQELHESFVKFHNTTGKLEDEKASLRQEIDGSKEYIQRLFEKIKAKEETIKVNNADALMVREKLEGNLKSETARHLEEVKNIKDEHCKEILKLKVNQDLFTLLLFLFFFIVESIRG